jgi:Fur family ferric uptake transcriptional regulator
MVIMQIIDNKEFFTSHGLKNTKSRNFIYNFLKQSDVPVTAEQIFLNMNDLDSAANLSTVYRILEIFVDKGIALKSTIIDSDKSMFELNRMEHKHRIVCIGCKRMFTMDGCPFEEYEENIRNKLGFCITGHKFEVFGYCKDCIASKK